MGCFAAAAREQRQLRALPEAGRPRRLDEYVETFRWKLSQNALNERFLAPLEHETTRVYIPNSMINFLNSHHHVHHFRPTGWGDAHVLL